MFDYTVSVGSGAYPVTANSRGHAYRLVFRKLLACGELKVQPRSDREGGFEGASIAMAPRPPKIAVLAPVAKSKAEYHYHRWPKPAKPTKRVPLWIRQLPRDRIVPKMPLGEVAKIMAARKRMAEHAEREVRRKRRGEHYLFVWRNVRDQSYEGLLLREAMYHVDDFKRLQLGKAA